MESSIGLTKEDFNKHGGNKRNDKVIKAFATYIKETTFKNPILILFEYGPDVEHSKELINQLGIAKNVKWQKKMPRKELLAGLKQADFAIDQIRHNIVGIGGTSLEAMAMGVPTITHTNGSTQNLNDFYYQAPFIDVLETDEILEVFRDFQKNPKKYKKIGGESKKWYSETLGDGVIPRFLALLQE